MTVALVVMTDGRVDCLDQTIGSLERNLTGPATTRVIWDDSGDLDHFHYLVAGYTGRGWWPTRSTSGQREGFGGAIRSAWSWLQSNSGEPFIVSWEDDMVLERPVDLGELVDVLDGHRYLAQMAFRRQAWNDAEIAAGGVVEVHPDAYQDRSDGTAEWLEHRLFVTTNAYLARRALIDVGWPDCPHSEGVFSHRVFAEGFDGIPGDQVRSGYRGARSDPPLLDHIGHVRVGQGY